MSFATWAATTCDTSSLALANGNISVADSASDHIIGEPTYVEFGVEANLDGVQTAYIGARARNALGAFGNWVWSKPCAFGAGTEAKIEEEESVVSLVTEINGYSASAASESDEIPKGACRHQRLWLSAACQTLSRRTLLIAP